ncbi:MAG: DNA repair protein RecN [Anaerolineaceae bacterium]
MLTELRIENFAIIDQLEIHFATGLITFTGETGAGKSIILDAIEALIGGRVDVSDIRKGADRSTLEAVFKLDGHTQQVVNEILLREELLDDPEYLTIGRELRQEGRTIARVNGRAVNVGLLREIGAYLVDIHGQSEHLSLLNVRQHLILLDRVAGSEELLSAYRETYLTLRAIRRELDQLRLAEKDAARRIDLLTYQINEIETAKVQMGEQDELRQERNRLANAENLAGYAQQALSILDEGSPESPAVTDLLGEVVQMLASLSKIDSQQTGLHEQVEGVALTLSELARDLRAYQDEIEFNPRRLEQIEERLELLHHLERKYGGSLESTLAFLDKARQELDQMTHATERIEALEAEEDECRLKLAEQAQRLSDRRYQFAEKLGNAVEKELADLNMAGAKFKVDLRLKPDGKGLKLTNGETVAFDESGIDQAEFLIAPNPGEGLKPMVKIASGGETSRLMLALKSVLAQADDIPTLIFDEIDQGIGGRVGTIVGEKLWQLGRQHQVLCVTHLPQLAAFGDQHFRVAKKLLSGRTTTQVEKLASEKREVELAIMLGGVSDGNLKAAREALTLAQSVIRKKDQVIS